MTADTAVVVENAEKWFGLNPALQNLSLRIDRGEFVVLLGRNGAGKSTLLQVMARLVQPNRGQVRICGVDVRQDPERGRERIGLVAHQTFLYPGLTARENLRLHARLHRLEGAAKRVAAALSDAGLELSADRPVRGFSRGMQQRLAIARASLHRPELLLLDEPFTGLDLEAAELLSERLRQWAAAGRTIVMATHNLEQGLQGVTRWILLDRGRIVTELTGDSPAVRSRYRQFLQGLPPGAGSRGS